MAVKSELIELIAATHTLLSEESVCFADRSHCDFFCKERVPQALAAPPPTPSAVAPAPPEEKKTIPPAPAVAAPLPSPAPKPMRSPLPRSSAERFEDMRAIVSKIAPQLPLCGEVPSDAEAKRIAERWKTKNQTAPLSLLTFQEIPEHRTLLVNLALALDVVFGGARLIEAAGIEKERQWEAFLSVPELKWVIVCDSTLWQLPQLLQFYREIPSRSERLLRETPLFLLPDLTLYLKDPLLKRSLWKALCQKIA